MDESQEDSQDDQAADVPQDIQADEESGSVNLNELTKAELIDYADGQGIDLNMKMTKADMIAEIEAE